MSITTYSELKTALTSWSHRADLSGRYDEFIDLAESRLNDSLRMLAQRQTQDLTASTSSRELAFPTGMRELLSLSLVINNDLVPLMQVHPDDMNEIAQDTSAQPTKYCVEDTIEFDRIPDQAYTVRVRTITDQTALSDSATTNDLLTAYPNIYLAGALVELFVFTQDDANAQKWDARFAEAVAIANNTAHRSTVGKLTTEFPLSGGIYDIETDS